MVKRCVLLGVLLLAASVIGAPAGAIIPNGVHLEAISANNVVTAVDASLLDAGSIKGAINALPGGIVSAQVVVYANGQQVDSTSADLTDHYEIDGLPTG